VNSRMGALEQVERLFRNLFRLQIQMNASNENTDCS
jgi:hypothetical protein